jgi:hypothetical protein
MLGAMRVLALAVAALPLVLAGCYLSHELEETRDAAPIDAPRVCPPMDVRSHPSCTVGVDAYWWWDGRACVGSPCACSGSDCDAVLRSESACERIFAGCPTAP